MLPEATAVSIANDILFDILSRMPARALRRFRCVSRQWRALLSDPAFLAAHKSRRPDPLLVDTSYFRGYREPDLRLRDLSGNIVRVIEGVGVMYFLTEGTSGTLLCFDLEKEQWKDDPIEGPSEDVGAKRYMHGSSSFGLYDPQTKTCTDILPDYLPGKNFLCKLHLEQLASVNN
ncbi:hypothetical protein ACQ4PT_015055 [Festuca glaucescens]